MFPPVFGPFSARPHDEVDYLHSRRIIHRDITENNVIISDDRPSTEQRVPVLGWLLISDLMAFYSDLMGFYGDLMDSDSMGFYSDSMGY